MCPVPAAVQRATIVCETVLSYSAIDNVLTNLLPADLQDFFQVINVSNATTTVNKLSDCSPDRIVHWV